MKLFKNIMSRKPEPEETVGKIDLDMDVEPLRRKSEPLDDTGRPNASKAGDPSDPLYADPSQPSYNRNEEPEEAAGAGWGSAWDDSDWDDDEDWGDDTLDDIEGGPAPAGMAAGRPNSQDRDWSMDADFGRRAIARSQLTGIGDDAEDRLLEKTNTQMTDSESSRRRSAMAHLKAAAAATKADRVLKHVASRDAAGDPEEQSPYRDDLAKVVRPRPTSRPTTRQRSITPPWSAGEGDADADASRFASAAEQSLEGDAQFLNDQNELDEFDAPDTGMTDDLLADASHDDEDDDGFADQESRFAGNEDRFATEESAFADGEDRFASHADRFATDESAFADDEDLPDPEAERFATDESALAEAPAAPACGSERAANIPDDLSEEDFSDGPAFDVNESAAFDRFGTDRFADDTADAEVEPVQEATAEPEPEEVSIFSDEDEDLDFDDGPVASTAVSDAVAMANEPDDPAEDIDDDAVRKQIWDVAGDIPVVRDPAESPGQRPAAAAPAEPSGEAEEAILNVATAVTGRAGRSAGRVKTRLLGFQNPEGAAPDVFEAARSASSNTETKFPVGWIIVIDGPGRGSCFTLFNGVSQIGRGEEQAVRLNFGDTSISRDNHAAVAYDDEQAKFFLGHGGKSNLVRLNGRPVLSTEELASSDSIRIGETTLKFMALCGDDFTWKTSDGEDADNGEDA